MLGLRKATNKSQTLKPLPVSVLCGPDAELSRGPPSYSRPGCSTGNSQCSSVTGLGLWNESALLLGTHTSHPEVFLLSFFLLCHHLGGYLSPAGSGAGSQTRARSCSPVGGKGLPGCSCSTWGFTWACSEETEARLAWAASPYLSLAETPSGVCPAMACLLLTCVMLQHSIKWTLDSCLLLPGTDVILAGP